MLECGDWRSIVHRYDAADTLLYVDPPYLAELRGDARYDHELTIADHEELVDRLLTLKGRAVVSGYPHLVYLPLEAAGWERIEKAVLIATNIQGRSRPSIAHRGAVGSSPRAASDFDGRLHAGLRGGLMSKPNEHGVYVDVTHTEVARTGARGGVILEIAEDEDDAPSTDPLLRAEKFQCQRSIQRDARRHGVLLQ